MKNRTLLLLLLVAGIFMPVMAQQEMQPLPIDPKVRYGKLTNGLTYYIRHNEQPKERADFYIAQRVGSMQEEDSQAGLAHFLEHMASMDQRISRIMASTTLLKALEYVAEKT